METLIRLAVATVLTVTSVLICHEALAVEGEVSKVSCHSQNRETLFDASIDSDLPKPVLKSVLFKVKSSVHRPVLDRENIEFFSDSTNLHVTVKRLANGQSMVLNAQPSVADATIWTGTLKLGSGDPVDLTCDLL